MNVKITKKHSPFFLLLFCILFPITGTEIYETEVQPKRVFITSGISHFEESRDFLWEIMSDLSTVDQWMLNNLDTPEGWKYPAYMKDLSYFPEFEVVELYYGLKLFGLIDANDLSAAFDVEKEVTPGSMRLTLMLSHPYPVVEDAVYFMELTDGIDGGTDISFQITTKLPPMIYVFFPKKIYNDNIHYILGHLVENFQERSQITLNP